MKKLLSSVLCLFLITMAVSGCQSNTGATSGNGAGAVSGTGFESSPQAEPADSGSEKAVIRMLVGDSGEELAAYQVAVDQFNAQSEKSVVELLGMPSDGYDEKILTALNSNNAPDCFYAEEALFGETALNGHLYPISDFIKAGNYGLTEADVPQSLLDAYTLNGNLYGVPVDSNPLVIFYNNDLIKGLGLRNPQELYEAGEWSFAAMQDIAENIRDDGKVGYVYANWWGPMYTMLYSANAPLFAEDGKSSNFTSPRALGGLRYLDQNIRSKAFVFVGQLNVGESPETLFMSGQAGMICGMRALVPGFEDLSFAWDAIPIPYFEKPEDAISPIAAVPLVINAKTANPELVWEFVSYYCGEIGQKTRLENAGSAVPTIPGLDEIVLTGKPEHDEYFLQAVENSVGYSSEEVANPGLSSALWDEMELMLIGEQDADTTATNLKQIADETLAK